jgi:hypothetical protein
VVFLLIGGDRASAQQVACAEVSIEIQQDLTLERQAFDARMRITNGLDTLPLENVEVDIYFEDEDGGIAEATTNPDSNSAAFYIRTDTQDAISLQPEPDFSASWFGGTIAPSTPAEIHWLIVPAGGAGGTSPLGKRYFVGATLRYMLGGEEEVVEVVPDAILVRPQPELQLDYFLPRHVRADDPQTTGDQEEIEPFTLGVRVRNNGYGVARNLSIESAQPRIVRNDLNLLIGFSITGGFVNDDPVRPTLLLNFGDFEPRDGTKMGRWIMQTTLAGEFRDFTARFTHADDLGGRLTSLIPDGGVSTHYLIHDVVVDLPGRDRVRDFLAEDGGVYGVYESENVGCGGTSAQTDCRATDQSASSSLDPVSVSNGIHVYRLSTPPTDGHMYVKLDEPLTDVGEERTVEIRRVVRANGTELARENFWNSEQGLGRSTDHFVNFFDTNGGGEYRVEIGAIEIGPEAPQFCLAAAPQPESPCEIPLASLVTVEGASANLGVYARDRNGDPISLRASARPVGSQFEDLGSGEGRFTWTPAVGQAGSYPVTFRASDGTLESTYTPTILVRGPNGIDTDSDGLDDDWERSQFDDLSETGAGDFDQDGVNNLDEYRRGTNPKSLPPGVPIVVAPYYGETIATRRPELRVANADPDASDTLDDPSYAFEVYADSALASLVETSGELTQGASGETAWTPAADLDEDSTYFWRARASVEGLRSEWTYGRFTVNTANGAPSAPRASHPLSDTVVDDLAPHFEVTNAVDPEGEPLVYVFYVSLDPDGAGGAFRSDPIAEGTGGTTSWKLTDRLIEDFPFYWWAEAIDPHGAATRSEASLLFVSQAGHASGAPDIRSPAFGAHVTSAEAELVVGRADDEDGDALSYVIEVDEVETFDGPGKRTLGPITDDGVTARTVVAGLADDTTYYWRAKSLDGTFESRWAVGHFAVQSDDDVPAAPSVANPGEGAVVDLLAPTLRLEAAEEPENDVAGHRFEIYRDANGLDLVASVLASDPRVRMSGIASTQGTLLNQLEDGRRYHWRARTEDRSGRASDWTSLNAFLVKIDGENDAPTIRLDEPRVPLTFERGTGSVRIQWTDADPDSTASVTLLANGEPIAPAIEEDPDAEGDVFVWDTSELAVGAYQLAARIRDGRSEATSEACCLVTIVEPPTACSDGIDNDRDGKTDFPEDDDCTDATTRTEVRGDIDFDGDVDSVDRSALAELDGIEADDPGFVAEADLNDDGRITAEDTEGFGVAAREYVQERFPNAICGISGLELMPLISALLVMRARSSRQRSREWSARSARSETTRRL